MADNSFVPPPALKWYYSSEYPTPETLANILRSLAHSFISPSDRTYGRDAVPRSPREVALSATPLSL